MTFKCLWGTECHDVLPVCHSLAKRYTLPSWVGRLAKAILTFIAGLPGMARVYE